MQLCLSQHTIFFFFGDSPNYAIQQHNNPTFHIKRLKQADLIEYVVNEETGKIDIFILRKLIDFAETVQIKEVKAFVRNWNDSLMYIDLNEYLNQHKSTFLDTSKLQPLKFKYFTWNIAGVEIGQMPTSEIKRFRGFDILFLAFQEFIPLTTAGSFKSSKSIDEAIALILKRFKPEYKVITVNKLFGMVSALLVRPDLSINVTDVEIHSLGTGFLNYGNKGSILTKVNFNTHCIFFLNCHLCTGNTRQALVKRRNELYTINSKFKLQNKSNGSIVLNDSEFFIDDEISKLDDFEVSSEEESLSCSHNDDGDGSMKRFIDTPETTVTSLPSSNISSFSTGDPNKNIIFIGGDLNYRLSLPRERVFGYLDEKDHSKLIEFDSLRRERLESGIFQDFREGEISFLPTYKFKIRPYSRVYDGERTPSYTDRVLYSESKYVKLLKYDSIPEMDLSDHEPVFADYEVRMPVIDNQRRRDKIKEFHTFRSKKVNGYTPKSHLIIENLENTKHVPILQGVSIIVKVKNSSPRHPVYFEIIHTKEDIVLKQKLEVTEDIPFTISPVRRIIPPQSEEIIKFSTILPIGITEMEKIVILRFNDTNDYFITTRFVARKSFFGSTLCELVEESTSGIPKPLYTLVNYLTNNTDKNMFRESEQNDDFKREIMGIVDNDEEVPPGTPSCTVASVLLLLLENLDGGIISSDLSTFLFDRNPDVELEDLLEQLPPLNVNTLIYLTSFLRVCYERGISMDIILEKFQRLLITVQKTRKRDFLSSKVNYEKLRSKLLTRLIKE